MYKMYNTHWDEESEDENNSLNSSFWSDGEREEEEEIERVIYEEEDSKPAVKTEDDFQDRSEEDLPGQDKRGNTNREASEKSKEEEKGDEESCCSSTDSPALSMLTSGYGTYRPEEQEGVDCRDDHTIADFDQESQEGLSEARDDEEDDCSLSNYGRDITEPTYTPDCKESRPLTVLEGSEYKANLSQYFGDDCFRSEMDDKDITDMKSEEDDEEEQVKSPTDERSLDNKLVDHLHAKLDNKDDTNARSEEHHVTKLEDHFVMGGKHLEDGSDPAEGKEYEKLSEEDQQNRKKKKNVEKGTQDEVEMEDPEELSGNKDIKFIDSKVDFSCTTYTDKMYEEWEGNQRHRNEAASGLEERLAQLHISTSTQHDSETENEDTSSPSDSQSSESEGPSLTAFESYIRGMARTQSALRPRSKSFIRPVLGQQTLKKTDPVNKYFQYKQLWKMFKLPGETDVKAIRREIQEQLAYQPPPPKPRRVYVPNTYVVPTEKKRSALRWEIRNDLANGLLPPRLNYRF